MIAWLVVTSLLGLAAGSVIGAWWTRRHPIHDAATSRRTLLLFELAEGNRDRVVSGLEELCRDEPLDMGAFLTLAALDRKKGRYDRAKAIHRTVLAAAGLSSEHRAAALYGLGRDLLAQGNARAAVGALSRAASLAPRSTAVLSALARALEGASAWERAATEWERLEKVTEGMKAREARVARGHALAGLAQEALELDEDPRKAQKVAERAIALAPDSGFAWTMRARAESMGGSLPVALEAWHRALALAPEAAPSFVREALSWADRVGVRQELLAGWRLSAAITASPAVIAALLTVDDLVDNPVLERALQRLATNNGQAALLWLHWLSSHGRDAQAREVVGTLLSSQVWLCRECEAKTDRFSFVCPSCAAKDGLVFCPQVAVTNLP